MKEAFHEPSEQEILVWKGLARSIQVSLLCNIDLLMSTGLLQAKIGVVKEMLFAHSSVMRSDLQVKDIKEKVPIKIQDIFPETFRILLRYVK